MKIQNQALVIYMQADGGLVVNSPRYDALQIGPLFAALTANGNVLNATSCAVRQIENAVLEVVRRRCHY